MKITFKSLIAAAAFIAAGAASATVLTVTAGETVYKGLKLSGSHTLSLSPATLDVLDVYRASVTPNAPGLTSVTRNDDQTLLSVAVAAPITSLTVDDADDLLQSAASAGGMTLTAPVQRLTPSGGSLTVTDLSVDLVSKRVYATIIGANGVGTLINYYLWDFDAVSGTTSVVLPNSGTAVNTFTVSGLRLTADGLDKVIASLGLGVPLSTGIWNYVTDFGTITVSQTSVAEPVILTPCSVMFKTTARTASTLNAEVDIHNHTSNAATGWKINWAYGKPTLVTNVKNAKITNMALKSYTARPVKANATVAAGGSSTFSFRGYTSSRGLPAISDLTATLGDQTCSVSAQ